MQDQGVAAGAEAALLKGLRVLLVCRGGDTAFAEALCAQGRKDFGWSVEAVCVDPARFCERQAWEDDPAQVAELDTLIGTCEFASGVSAGRILLAGERDLGRGFSTLHFDAPLNAISRAVTTDVAEPFRIVRRMFAFVRDTLDRKLVGQLQPGLVLTNGWGDPLCFVFHLVARQRGIACAAFRPSPIWKTRRYFADTLTSFNLAARKRAAEKRAANDRVSANAQDYIAAFRSRSGADAGVTPSINASRQRRQAPFLHRFGADTLASLRYVYMALQEDPSEALNLQAPFWANQYNTAALLTGSLPAGYKLLVHEHAANVGRRPHQYYEDLSRLPGLALIDATEPRFNYVANAALVVTENGPAGWEGLLLGRPVLALADNFYQGTGMVRRLRNPEDLSATVLELLAPALAGDAADGSQPLGWMLDAEWETTAPMEDIAAALALLRKLLERLVETSGVSRARAEAVS